MDLTAKTYYRREVKCLRCGAVFQTGCLFTYSDIEKRARGYGHLRDTEYARNHKCQDSGVGFLRNLGYAIAVYDTAEEYIDAVLEYGEFLVQEQKSEAMLKKMAKDLEIIPPKYTKRNKK